MLIRDVTYLFLAAWVFIAAGGLSRAAMRGATLRLQGSGLIPAASLIAQHCSRHAGSHICGSQALEHDLSRMAQGYLLGGMWDLPGAGIKSMSPALAGKFLTTVPPEKPLKINFLNVSTTDNCGKFFISLCILSLYYYSCYVWTFRFHEIITLEFTSPSHIMNKYVPSHIGQVTKILSQFTQKFGHSSLRNCNEIRNWFFKHVIKHNLVDKEMGMFLF